MIDENETPAATADGRGKERDTDTPEYTTKSAENPILKAALRNAAQGLAIFPCDANRKPRFKGWPELASVNPAQIGAWLRHWPGTWLGVAAGEPSRVFVLDVDMKNGKNGKASLAALEAKYGPLPVTLTATTRNGGKHYYFRYVPGFGNSTSELAPGLDIKTARGYVIAPPSPGYIWDNEGTPIAEAPPWLIQLLIALKQPRKPSTQTADVQPCPPVTEATPYGRASMAGIVDEMKRAEPGTRNDTLNRLAFRFGQLVSGGQFPENAGEELKAAARLTGLDDAEIERTFQSGFVGGLKEPYTPASRAFADGSDIGAEIARLAGLPPLEFEQARKVEAKRLGIRPSVLDAAVKAARQDDAEKDKLPFETVAPWPEGISPSVLLSEIVGAMRRFVILSTPAAADATALWVAMSWLVDSVDVLPILAICSPEKRCGKTSLLTLLGKMTARPVVSSNISAAALYRAIDLWRPTLLIDEADSFIRESEDLRGIIDSGHSKDAAFVVRVTGEELVPARFNTFCPKVIASIGKLADTLMDRAIVIEMRRRLPGELVEKMRHAEPGLFDRLRRQLARFAEDYAGAVKEARPSLPESLNDRAADNWSALLAIAAVVGDGWLERGAKAALELSDIEKEQAQSLGTELLADIRSIFEEKGVDRIDGAGLMLALCGIPEGPWSSYNRGNHITQRQIAVILRGFAVSSGAIRQGGGVARGYMKAQFADAFRRYLPEKNIFD